MSIESYRVLVAFSTDHASIEPKYHVHLVQDRGMTPVNLHRCRRASDHIILQVAMILDIAICLQCQDTFGEGYSRYIESDSPIVADKLNCIAESAVKAAILQRKSRNVSVGTMEKVYMEERGDM